MKNKILLSLAVMLLTVGCSSAQSLSTDMAAAIGKYKAKNYVGCMQDALEITQKDPANALAHYYLGISYVQLGDKEKAIESYQKVISLSSNETLKEYAQRGELCLNSPDECSSKYDVEEFADEELHKFINSTKAISKEVSDKIDEIQIELMKQNINKEADRKSEVPSNDEIANAVKVLAKAGVNPLAMQNNPYVQAQNALSNNSEYMQLQMLLGGNTNQGNDFMSMLPFFMMQGNGKNNQFSADIMKNMMMSSMIGNLNTTFDFNDNK